MRKIGRSTYLDKQKTGSKILKYEPPSTGGVLQRISRALFKGSLPFENEIYVNRLLKKTRLKHFKYPSSTYDAAKKCITFEVIEGEESRLLSLSSKEEAVNSLIEFSNSGDIYQRKGLKYIVFRFIESPTIKTAKIILNYDCGFYNKIKSLKIFVSFLIKRKNRKSVLLHNDLKCKNIILTKDKGVFFIDFEDVIKEKTMVLMDIVNVLFDYQHCTINKKLLEKYCYTVFSGKDINGLDIPTNIRVCFLSISMSNCLNKESSFRTKDQRNQFLETILNDKHYNTWWSKL